MGQRCPSNIGAGDLVRSKLHEVYGVVHYVDKKYVRVEWEDGKHGIFYWDRTAIACAYNLALVQKSRQLGGA